MKIKTLNITKKIIKTLNGLDIEIFIVNICLQAVEWDHPQNGEYKYYSIWRGIINISKIP